VAYDGARTHARLELDKETPVNPEGSGDARAEVLAELHDLRGRFGGADGSVVATTDGMVIAHDLGALEPYGVAPENVAALTAVNLGLAHRISDTASHGDLREVVIRGEFGQVATYAAGERALLAILVRSTEDLGPLHVDAREAAERIAGLLAGAWEDDAATWHGPA